MILRRLFLTGGSGYVGRNLIRHFVAQGVEVVALVRSERSAQVVQALGAVPFVSDLLHERLGWGMDDCQALIHSAADTNHDRGVPVEFRSFVTSLLETQGISAPDKSVPRWLVRGVATVGDFVAALSGGRVIPPISFQKYATSAVEVTVDISKARKDLGYHPVIAFKEGVAELQRSE